MSIPSVGVERLRLVAKVQNQQRKRTSIMNGQMTDRLDTYTNMLERHSTMTEVRIQRHTIPYQRELVEKRSYAIALAERGDSNLRKCRSLEELPPYGLYEGATMRELRYDIERIKDKYKPEKVRARKAEKLVVEGVKTGKILPQHEVPFRFHDLMTRKFDHEKGRFTSRDSTHRPKLDSRGLLLPPIDVGRSRMRLKTSDDKLQGLKRSHTYTNY